MVGAAVFTNNLDQSFDRLLAQVDMPLTNFAGLELSGLLSGEEVSQFND
jgi:hypothetical protein